VLVSGEKRFLIPSRAKLQDAIEPDDAR